MPIENERKFVLKDDGDLERRLAERPGVTKSFLRQAYLDVSGMRIRRLWSQRRETLQKVRYSWSDGPFHWDVDFFKADDNRTYFTQAEVEMPEEQTEPPPLPASLAGYLLATAPAGDPRFASKRLADQAHAEKLLADIKSKGRIE